MTSQLDQQDVMQSLARKFRALARRRQSMLIDDGGLRRKRISRFEVDGFRNLSTVSCSVGPGVTLFAGANNSGKTNLLTALMALFPELLVAELVRFADSGDGYGMFPAQFHFVKMMSGGDSSPLAIIRAEAEGVARIVGLRAVGNGLNVGWFDREKSVASLQLDEAFSRYKVGYEATVPHIDQRRFRRSRIKEASAEIKLLQERLWGTMPVSFHQGAADEGAYVDELEWRIAAFGGRLGSDEFIRVFRHWFDAPGMRFDPITRLGYEILPTPASQRRKEEIIRRLILISDALRGTLDETKSTGKKVLQGVEQELKELRGQGRGGSIGGGLRLLAEGQSGGFAGIAKTLGSGFRSLLLLVHKVLTSRVCFIDEPETYLHPRLQERLAAFLLERSQDCQIFMTTHSPILLNAVSADNRSHVYELKDGQAAPVAGEGIVSQADADVVAKLLSGLGVRPRHAFMADAVVWVEGASDRIYLSSWIDLWSNGSLQEGRDFVCMPYGGSGQLKRFSFAELPVASEIMLVKLNRNCIFIVDSDRESEEDPVEERRARICSEVERIGGVGWVTAGREIENYIPRDVLSRAGYETNGIVNKFVDVPSVLRRCGATRRGVKKMVLASDVAAVMTRRDLEQATELASSLDKVCTRLLAWTRG